MLIEILNLESAILLFDGLADRSDIITGGMQIISGLHPQCGKIAITIGPCGEAVVASEKWESIAFI